MSSPQIPEALGPGSADPSGLVHYGLPPTAPAPGGLPRGEPPEARGPGSETTGGELVYGVPGWRSGPMPGPTAAEREAERELREQLTASCQCSVIPAVILYQLAGLAAQGRRAVRVGSGCPRCRAVPAQLIGHLADALDAAHPRPRTRELEGASR
jgi:hypothetical protein